MSKTLVLAFMCLALSASAGASPDPPLPWVSSNFSVRLDTGTIEFNMECPQGKLTRLSASREGQFADVPMERLVELALPQSCSGVSTRAFHESETSPEVIAVELKVELSREYIREELLIVFDIASFKFTDARRLLTYPGEKTEVTRVEL